MGNRGLSPVSQRELSNFLTGAGIAAWAASSRGSQTWPGSAAHGDALATWQTTGVIFRMKWVKPWRKSGRRFALESLAPIRRLVEFPGDTTARPIFRPAGASPAVLRLRAEAATSPFF